MINFRIFKREIFGKLPGILAIILAVWLLWPFVKIDQSDYDQGKILVYRLAFGLMILIIMLGKMGFDVFFPQGVAQKVSKLKSALFLIFGILLLAFLVYIIVQAGSLFLSTYPQTTDFQSLTSKVQAQIT